MHNSTSPDENDMQCHTHQDRKTETRNRESVAPYAPEESTFQVDSSEKSTKTPTTERRARKKANKVEFGQCSSYHSSDSEYDEETQPGAYGIAGLKADNDPIEEDQRTDDESSLGRGDVNDGAMLVEAKLAPELTSAEEVNIQEEEDMIVQKKQYKQVLFSAMVFYSLAIIGNIIAFVLLFVNPPPAYGRLYNLLWNGLVGAVLFLFIATGVIFIPTMPCGRTSTRLEKYAPDDEQLLRDVQKASAASLSLFFFIALPIIICLPNLQWLGYAFMVWFFAGTVFAFSCVCRLRRSTATRPKRSILFWIPFVVVFLGLTGISIWSCLNPVYPDCNVPYASWIGDGWCQPEPYNTEACGYDGGDCVKFLGDYPGCNVRWPLRVGDGQCDGGAYNTLECGYDGGDCAHENKQHYPDCIVPNPSWIGDGTCDGIVYGTVECGFDGGDCLGPGERCRGHKECGSEVCNNVTKVCDSAFGSQLYPDCRVGMPDWIGDGECDGGFYASEECGFDGGDCLELSEPCILDEECASGFCNVDMKMCYLGILENYPACIVEFPQRIGNGKCDGGAYASYECGYDGGDCLDPAF